MSEHALVYDTTPLAHRMLLVYEADGVSGELASALLRTLLSEGRITYTTVEKTKDGMKPRTIDRPGPTGLITMTTALNLHPENETRLLSLTVPDTQGANPGRPRGVGRCRRWRPRRSCRLRALACAATLDRGRPVRGSCSIRAAACASSSSNFRSS
jgi:hypothetical protein